MKLPMQDKWDRLAQKLPPYDKQAEREPLPCTGDCGSCRLRGRCRPYGVSMLTKAEWFADSPKQAASLTLEELGRALSLAEPFAQWLSEMQDYALGELLRGRRIPGWKAIEGRSNRRFTDCDAAFAALVRSGVPESSLYERKPLSLSQVERLVGKNEFRRAAGEFVEKPLGKPVLVPESDPAKPYPPAGQARP